MPHNEGLASCLRKLSLRYLSSFYSQERANLDGQLSELKRELVLLVRRHPRYKGTVESSLSLRIKHLNETAGEHSMCTQCENFSAPA